MFTIIIPTHKRPLLLQRALLSLIHQTWRDFQVIVVDDAAAYLPPFVQLAELVQRYTYIIRSGEPGPAASRNLALDLVRTPYVMFLDDDDSLEPDHLEKLAAHLEAHPAPLLFCDFQVQYEDRSTDPIQPLQRDRLSIAQVTRDSVYVLNRIPNSCLVYRRDVLDRVRFDTTLPLYEDWEFLLQCLRHHDLQHLATDGVVIHKSQATSPENMRRGNARNDLVGPVTMALYQMHPAPNAETRTARHALLASAGLNAPPGI